MVGGFARLDVELMPMPSMLARLASARRVDARRQLCAFNDALTAARGEERDVRRTRSTLRRAAGVPGRDVNDLQSFLGGG